METEAETVQGQGKKTAIAQKEVFRKLAIQCLTIVQVTPDNLAGNLMFPLA